MLCGVPAPHRLPLRDGNIALPHRSPAGGGRRVGGAGAFKRAEATARALVNPKRRGGDMASTHAAAASDTVSTGFEPIAPEADASKIVVALGKFDAMHRGHAQLARRASKMGTPYLMSFSGMAEVLGWESKLPVVAECDRPRVCTSWAAGCNGQTVKEHCLPFAAIRRMSPEEFVLTLKEIGVGGVVAGRNYRFGFKAAGTADTLTELGKKHGVDVEIVDLLQAEEDECEDGAGGVCTPQVSSTRVRACLAAGDVEQVTRLLGRPHRLMLRSDPGNALTFPLSAALNQYPKVGSYVGAVMMLDEDTEGGEMAGAGTAEVVVTLVVNELGFALEVAAGDERRLLDAVGRGSKVCVDITARAL